MFNGCSQKSDQLSDNESKITLLCKGNERSAFSSRPSTQHLLFLPLVVMDEERQPQPRLLERWKHSDDYTEWTFFLRKDIKWHDGKPVTAHDVKFTLELITDPNIMFEVRLFDEITIVDNFTCHLRSSKPFYALIYYWFGILPSHLLGDLDTASSYSWEFWKQPVGNGPYRYVRHVPDTMVELEVNPDYYGQEPKIKRVVLKFGGNPVTELLSGNVDAVKDLQPLEILHIAKDRRFNLYHEFDVTKVFSIIWNHQSPLFQNPSVRRALTLAINRRELYQVLSFPEDTPIFDVAITPGQFSRGEVPAPFPYDPEQAKRLLDEAGWVETSKDGIREKNGHKFRFSLFFSAELMPGAVYIQDQFRRVGIDMETVTMDLSVSVGRVREGKFDAIFCGFHSFDYGRSYGGYDNPEFERLKKNVFSTTTPEEFDSAARKLWPIFQSDIPWTFLYPSVTFNIVHRRIRGLKSPNRSDPAKFIEHLIFSFVHNILCEYISSPDFFV
jgi:peptide/nickel transport system substrate-binding protein